MTTLSSGIRADLTWIGGRSSACLLRAVVGSVSLRPCVGVEVGALTARTTNLTGGGQSFIRPWVAPHLVGRMAWTPTEHVFFEIEAGVAVPLVRDDFVVEPSVLVHRSSAIVPALEIGGGVRFP